MPACLWLDWTVIKIFVNWKFMTSCLPAICYHGCIFHNNENANIHNEISNNNNTIVKQALGSFTQIDTQSIIKNHNNHEIKWYKSQSCIWNAGNQRLPFKCKMVAMHRKTTGKQIINKSFWKTDYIGFAVYFTLVSV